MTRSRHWVLAGACSAILSACASTPSASHLASDREVTDYVESHWSYFTARAAYLAGREGQANVLLSVKSQGCKPDQGNMKCNFITKVRFSDGVEASPELDSFFGRQPDGSIEQLLEVIYAPG